MIAAVATLILCAAGLTVAAAWLIALVAVFDLATTPPPVNTRRVRVPAQRDRRAGL